MARQVAQADRDELGRRGEQLAEFHLRRAGLRVVARRFRTPTGEIDLIMRDGTTVVFVEVKTRRSRRHSDPEEAVRGPKQERMARTAAWFLRHKRWENRPCRFDVVAVVLAEGGEPEIVHHPDAFHPA